MNTLRHKIFDMKFTGLLVFIFICHSAFGQHDSFILQDEKKLASAKKQYQAGDRIIGAQIDTLLAQAGSIVKEGPAYSVTFLKQKPAGSGDKHDYISQAPYWWADSTKADGLPYIHRDGRINPERNLSKDYGQMGRMSSDVKQLALAYYFTGEEKYAARAVRLMQVWFIDTATRMNPNLNFGQFIPGITTGRGIGIIETVGLTNIPDAIAMMQGSPSLTHIFDVGIKGWFREYVQWLMNDQKGKDERAAKNNHGTYYDLQLADFALFTGDTSLAKKVIMEQTIPRIDQQFTVEGAEPLELVRTKSWGYSTMNLVGWVKLAILADRVGIDLWHKETTDGKGIKKVLDWFIPYMLKQKSWNYEQIEPMNYNFILTVYRKAVVQYPGNAYGKIIALYPGINDSPWW